MNYHFIFIKKLASIHLLFGYITQSCSGPHNLTSQFPNQQALTIIKTCQASYFSFPYILASWLVYVTLSTEKDVEFIASPSSLVKTLPNCLQLACSYFQMNKDGQLWLTMTQIQQLSFYIHFCWMMEQQAHTHTHIYIYIYFFFFIQTKFTLL